MKLFFNISVLLLLLCNGCNNDPVLSEIPEIDFQSATIYKSIEQKDSMIIVSIKYKDGDGDLGLSEADTFPPYNYGGIGFNNLLVKYQVMNNNIWQSIVIPGGTDTLNFDQRFQRLNPNEKKRTVSGTMDLRIPASPYPGIFPEAIKLSFQMFDRKMHSSAVVQSDEIKLKH